MAQPGGDIASRRAAAFPRSRAISQRICSASGRGAGAQALACGARRLQALRRRCCLSGQSPSARSPAEPGSRAHQPPWEALGTAGRGPGRLGVRRGVWEPGCGMPVDLGGMPPTREALCRVCALPCPAGPHKTKQQEGKQQKGLFGDVLGTRSPHCPHSHVSAPCRHSEQGSLPQQLSGPFSAWGLRGSRVPFHVRLSQSSPLCCFLRAQPLPSHPLSRRRGLGGLRQPATVLPTLAKGQGAPRWGRHLHRVQSPGRWPWLCPLPRRSEWMRLEPCGSSGSSLSCPRRERPAPALPSPGPPRAVASVAGRDPVLPAAC